MNKEKYKMYSLKKKMDTKKCNGPMPSAQVDKIFKEKSDDKRNKGSDDLRVKYHRAKLPSSEK